MKGNTYFISLRSDTRLNNVSKGWLNLMKRAKIENFRFHEKYAHLAPEKTKSAVDLLD